MAKLLHPGNSWKVLKKEAMRLFLLWYSALGEQAGDQVHAIFATLVPGFPSPYPNMGLTALAALTPEPGMYHCVNWSIQLMTNESYDSFVFGNIVNDAMLNLCIL